MDRASRNLQHTKSLAVKFKSGGMPTLGDLQDGAIEVRNISGRGVYIVTRINNKLYFTKMLESPE